MKKYLHLLPVIILPYTILFCLYSMYTGFLMESVFDNDGLYLLLLLFVFYFVAIVNASIVFIANLAGQRSAIDILRLNMIIKLVHIPAYIVIFLFGFAFLITIFTFAISVIFMILDSITIFCSGLVGVSGIIKSRKNGLISKKSAILHSILQFIFCIDIVSAVYIYKVVSRSKLKEKTVEFTE